MNSPLITVIVPCYKVERYLHKCVNSILLQTYTNLEIILVDDGSPDNCGKICDEYLEKDSRIKVIHKENGGLSDARNVAIDIAIGEYITFIDSDDYVSVDYIETLYNLIEKYNCQISIVLPQTFHEGQEPVCSNDSYHEICYSSKEAMEQMFYQTTFDNTAWGKLYHKSVFATGIRYPKGLLYEDLPTTYLLFNLVDKITFCNKKCYFYLLRNDSIEGSAFSTSKMDSALRIFDMMDRNTEIFSKIRKAYNCRMLSFSFHLLLKMPESYNNRNVLYHRIKELRKGVLLDSKARRKARIASLLSYLGLNLVRKVFVFIDQRK